MECSQVFWKDFMPKVGSGIDGFFRPVQTWTLGGWVVFSRAMGLPQIEGGGRLRVRETGSHRDSTRSLQPGGRHCQQVTMVTGGMWFPQQCRTFPQPSLPFPPISTWNNLFLCSIIVARPLHIQSDSFEALRCGGGGGVVWPNAFACVRVNVAHAFAGSSNRDS